MNGLGLTFTENDDPFEWMKYSSTLRLNEAKVVDFHTRADSASNDCHSAGFPGTTNVIKLRFTGGGTTNGLFDLQTSQRNAFVLRDASGNSMETGYLGVAGMNGDWDNNFDLCLDDTFDMKALDNVYVSCDAAEGTVLVPPKGPNFPCTAHSLKVDKSRASQDYKSECKCDFDHFYDAVCDPDGRLPESHDAHGLDYCRVFEPTSSCEDIEIKDGIAYSSDACSYRRSEWGNELTECSGLTEDARVPSAEICKANCEEDDRCEVYQFYDDGSCFRGISRNCYGSRTVVAGGRRRVPVCGGDYLAYCNFYPDLQIALCGGNWCTTEDQEAQCKFHFDFQGVYEGRHLCQDPACDGDYLAYCNFWPDLQNALCGGNWCSTTAEFAACKTHFEHQGRWEGRDVDVCLQPACGGDYLAYCNAWPDLQTDFCGGKWCSTTAEAAACRNHFEHSGRWENRDYCLQPACGGDFLAYCNAYTDLRNALCGGNECSTDAEAALCQTHFELQGGPKERRDHCWSPERGWFQSSSSSEDDYESSYGDEEEEQEGNSSTTRRLLKLLNRFNQ